MPTTSSWFSPTTGIREKPLRRASESACSTVLSLSMNTMSVRGHHHLADDRVAQLEHRVDHLALARLDAGPALEVVDEAAQLGPGHRAPGSSCGPARRGGGRALPHGHQQAGQRAEDPGQRVQERGGPLGGAFGLRADAPGCGRTPVST